MTRVNRVNVLQADITTLPVDVIVNAANVSLLGGGGVDGAIHRAAGPGLLAECRSRGGCAVGCAKVTLAYDLPATHVVHTVGPVWRGGEYSERELLASCYRTCLSIAAELGAASMSFPAISTGVYGYPLEAAAEVAVEEVCQFLDDHALPGRVYLVAFDARTHAALFAALAKRNRNRRGQ